MTTTAAFLDRVDAARGLLGHSDSYLSRLIFDDGKVVGRLRAGSGSVTIARLERADLALGELLKARSTANDLAAEPKAA